MLLILSIRQNMHLIYMQTKQRLTFEDSSYPQALVDRINMLLCDYELNATEMWYEICRAEHHMYSHRDSPNFEGLAYQLSLETVPREELLMIIMRKRVPGYRALMQSFGVVIPEEYR